MRKSQQEAGMSVDQIHMEMMGVLRENVPGQRWVSPSQRKTWYPPTDVYETDDCVIVKVEIAGMEEGDFTISLEGKKLTISGIRRDPAAKVGYQQMEILYGHFETHAHLFRAIDEDAIEATYQQGFLVVRLPKARPHQVPVVKQAGELKEESS
jgi:HSP20 family protein